MLKRFNLGVQTLMIIGILISINVIASYFHNYIDLTEDKRFTITSSTKKIINDIPDVIFVRVLLDGEFPAGFKRLQQSTKEILDQFASENGFLEYQFEDPNAGTAEEINARRKEFTKFGLLPTNL
ncbi:MAG: Gldg family protein, partial [Saprospiraceae bacterium]